MDYNGKEGAGAGNPNQDSLVSHPPADTVSCLRWSPSANLLCASSWSHEVRIWDVGGTGQATPKLIFTQQAPILTCDWTHGGDSVIYGGCEGIARLSSTNQPSTLELGAHAAPIRSLIWNKTLNYAVSGSWDKTVRFFDPRKSSANKCEVMRLKMGERVHAMDNRENLLAVAMADRTAVIYDLRHYRVPFREYLNPFLDKQSTSLVLFPDLKAFAFASIEGRVRIQYLEAPSDKERSFTFRCHKVGDYDAYAVNALAVSDAHDALATAGSDGSFVFWDKEHKRKLKQFERMQQPLTASAFNRNSTIFAYATGNDWSRGLKFWDKNAGTQILLHSVDQTETTTN
jgi:mRNA export factor